MGWSNSELERIAVADDFRIAPLREDLAMHRRLCAQRWYWRGVLEPDRRLSHWREAVSRFRMAECSAAATELIGRMARAI